MRRTLLPLGLVALALTAPSTSRAAPLSSAFKPRVQYAQVGDVKLAYCTRGKGPPLLMVNGFLSTRRTRRPSSGWPTTPRGSSGASG